MAAVGDRANPSRWTGFRAALPLPGRHVTRPPNRVPPRGASPPRGLSGRGETRESRLRAWPCALGGRGVLFRGFCLKSSPD